MSQPFKLIVARIVTLFVALLLARVGLANDASFQHVTVETLSPLQLVGDIGGDTAQSLCAFV